MGQSLNDSSSPKSCSRTSGRAPFYYDLRQRKVATTAAVTAVVMVFAKLKRLVRFFLLFIDYAAMHPCTLLDRRRAPPDATRDHHSHH